MNDLAWILIGLVLIVLGGLMYAICKPTTIIVTIGAALMTIGVILVALKIFKEDKEEEPRKH